MSYFTLITLVAVNLFVAPAFAITDSERANYASNAVKNARNFDDFERELTGFSTLMNSSDLQEDEKDKLKNDFIDALKRLLKNDPTFLDKFSNQIKEMCKIIGANFDSIANSLEGPNVTFSVSELLNGITSVVLPIKIFSPAIVIENIKTSSSNNNTDGNNKSQVQHNLQSRKKYKDQTDDAKEHFKNANITNGERESIEKTVEEFIETTRLRNAYQQMRNAPTKIASYIIILGEQRESSSYYEQKR